MSTISNSPTAEAEAEGGPSQRTAAPSSSTAPSSCAAALRGWPLWRAWVAANALGELVGLAIPAVVGVALAQRGGPPAGRTAELLGAGAMVLAGALEGLAVGLAQWWVLRRVFPALNAARWIGWTALGAAVAWACGMLPSLLLHHADGAAAAPDFSQMSALLKYTLAAALGVVLGSLLGIPQWLVLRRHVRRAGWWIPANSAAWALGMPIIFAAASSAAPWLAPPWLALVAGAAFLLAGAVVGAVHGLVLVWLAAKRDGAGAAEPSAAGASC